MSSAKRESFISLLHPFILIPASFLLLLNQQASISFARTKRRALKGQPFLTPVYMLNQSVCHPLFDTHDLRFEQNSFTHLMKSEPKLNFDKHSRIYSTEIESKAFEKSNANSLFSFSILNNILNQS